MKQHRVGIIGLGTVGGRFVEQFGLHDRFNLVAAWDANPSTRERWESTISVVDSARDVVIASDVVYIAVPPAAHAEYVQLAVSEKTAVFCEKPLGVDLDESESIRKLVNSSGLASAVNFVFGSAPSAVALHRAVHDGTLGEIRSADYVMHLAEWPRAWQAAATWLAESAEGGWTREVSSHYAFLAHRVFGSLRLVDSNVRRPSPERAEDLVTARFTAGDVEITFHGESGSAGNDSLAFTVHGSEQSMRIIDWYRLERTNGSGEWEDVAIDTEPTAAWAAYRAQLDGLARLLDGEPTSLPTFDEAFEVQRLIESILNTNEITND